METGKKFFNKSGNDEERKTQTSRIASRNTKEVSYSKCEKNCCARNGVGNCRNEDKRDGFANAEEQPMDLTFSQRLVAAKQRSESSTPPAQDNNMTKVSDSKVYDEATTNATFTIAKILNAEHLYSNMNVPKKRGRKRKAGVIVSARSAPYDTPEYVHTVDSRQAEVLMAAKSLFSKRTRTLYHWMYPNTPKSQLKSTVSMSWETLGMQEKEFYISQVLGRFGFPQSSLMVNPQLGGLRGLPFLPPLNLSSPSLINSETNQAVSTILEDSGNNPGEINSPWGQYNVQNSKRMSRKRLGRPPGSKNQKHLKEQSDPLKPVAIESIGEDFQDDPELRLEFEQFKWALT